MARFKDLPETIQVDILTMTWAASSCARKAALLTLSKRLYAALLNKFWSQLIFELDDAKLARLNLDIDQYEQYLEKTRTLKLWAPTGAQHRYTLDGSNENPDQFDALLARCRPQSLYLHFNECPIPLFKLIQTERLSHLMISCSLHTRRDETDLSSWVPLLEKASSSLRSLCIENVTLGADSDDALAHLPNLRSLDVTYTRDCGGIVECLLKSSPSLSEVMLDLNSPFCPVISICTSLRRHSETLRRLEISWSRLSSEDYEQSMLLIGENAPNLGVLGLFSRDKAAYVAIQERLACADWLPNLHILETRGFDTNLGYSLPKALRETCQKRKIRIDPPAQPIGGPLRLSEEIWQFFPDRRETLV